MPDTKISALTVGDPALGTDEIPAARAGGNVKLTAQSIADLAAGAAAVPSDFMPPIFDDLYYFPPGYDPAAGATNWAPDTLFAWPIWFSEEVDWTRIGVTCVDNVAATSMRLGIYSNGTDNKPGALLLDAGAVALDPFGDKEITIAQTLQANTLYWLAAVHDDASNLISTYAMDPSVVYQDFGRRFGLTGATASFPGYNRAFTYAALPASWGTPDVVDSAAPAIWLRKV
jgi:hypothetical protein